jgi:anti-sigma regulatory factor (Ser/Thr protein kinase)
VARAAGYVATVTLPAQAASVRLAAVFLTEGARLLAADEARQALFPVAVAEVVGNAVRHGAAADDLIVCELEMSPAGGAVRVFDRGPGFAPDAVAPPAVDVPVAHLPESGFGLAIVGAVFPHVRAVRRGERFGVELPLTVS